MLGGDRDRTLFVLAAEWLGPAKMFEGSRTGRVLSVAAPAPRAGWPGQTTPSDQVSAKSRSCCSKERSRDPPADSTTRELL
jgi:hypothetical protein